MTEAADRPYRRLVLRGTVATGVANGWAMVLGLVTLPILLSGLGADAFGLWVLLQTFSATTGWLSLGDLGLTTSTTRFVAAHQATGEQEASGSVALTAVLAVAGLGAVWGVVLAVLGPALLTPLFKVPDDLSAPFRAAIWWFSLQVTLDLALRGLLAVLEGHQRVDRSRGIEMARRTVATGGPALAAALGAGLAATVAVGAVGTAVVLIGSLALVMWSDLPWRRPSWSSLRRLTGYGAQVAFLRPLGVLHRTMDRIVVGAVLGPAPVVLVEIATQIQSGSEAALSAASYGVTPSASWVDARGDAHRLRELVEVGTRYTLLVTLPLVAVSMLLAAPLIEVWVGPEHLDAVPAALLALAYTAVTAPLQVGSNLLVGVGRAGTVLRAAAAGLSINLVASLVLVHAIGAVGAFAATLLSGVVLVPVLGRAILERVGLAPRSFLVRSVWPPTRAAVVLAAFVAVPVVLPLPAWPTLIAGAGAMVLGGAALPRLGLEPGELRSLARTLRRPAGVAA